MRAIGRVCAGTVRTMAILVSAAVTQLPAGEAHAQFGPHANGVLVPHIQPGLEYSSGQTYEGLCELRSCEDAVVAGVVPSGDEISAQVFYVIAGLEDCPGPLCLGGVDFGFENYDASAIAIVADGLCNEGYLALPTEGWPGPNEGVALVFEPCRRQKIVEVAWFAAYVYAAGVLPLGPDPRTHYAAFAEGEASPTIEDRLEDYQLGVLAFGQAGYNPCGVADPEGACCLAGRCKEVTRSDCDFEGGIFYGENTNCFPNPCDPPQPTTWGRVKLTYQ